MLCLLPAYNYISTLLSNNIIKHSIIVYGTHAQSMSVWTGHGHVLHPAPKHVPHPVPKHVIHPVPIKHVIHPVPKQIKSNQIKSNLLTKSRTKDYKVNAQQTYLSTRLE
jgi:hypothetical protein